MSDETYDYEFDCDGPIAATVRVAGGDVAVRAQEAPKATVRVAPYDNREESREAAARTRVEFSAGTLRVSTPEDTGWLSRHGRVRVELALPERSGLRVDVGSADVRTDGRLADVTVHSGSGDITVAESESLAVESGSGDVRADRVAGRLRIKTGSGDVSTGWIGGDANVHVASGDVHLGEVVGPVRATSASGDIVLDSVHAGEVSVRSASGDVRIGVPAGTGVWLDLNTVSGSTSTDLAMTGSPPAGGASLALRVHTVSGDIAVHRTTAAAA